MTSLAVVVFRDSKYPGLRWLKAGWRHCFVAVTTPGGWVALDPLLHWTQIHWLPVPADMTPDEIAAAYMHDGATAAAIVEIVEPPRRWRLPPMPLTCVEAVKRVIGVQSHRIWTPWQLFRHLARLPALDVTHRS